GVAAKKPATAAPVNAKPVRRRAPRHAVSPGISSNAPKYFEPAASPINKPAPAASRSFRSFSAADKRQTKYRARAIIIVENASTVSNRECTTMPGAVIMQNAATDAPNRFVTNSASKNTTATAAAPEIALITLPVSSIPRKVLHVSTFSPVGTQP